MFSIITRWNRMTEWERTETERERERDEKIANDIQPEKQRKKNIYQILKFCFVVLLFFVFSSSNFFSSIYFFLFPFSIFNTRDFSLSHNALELELIFVCHKKKKKFVIELCDKVCYWWLKKKTHRILTNHQFIIGLNQWDCLSCLSQYLFKCLVHFQ